MQKVVKMTAQDVSFFISDLESISRVDNKDGFSEEELLLAVDYLKSKKLVVSFEKILSENLNVFIDSLKSYLVSFKSRPRKMEYDEIKYDFQHRSAHCACTYTIDYGIRLYNNDSGYLPSILHLFDKNDLLYCRSLYPSKDVSADITGYAGSLIKSRFTSTESFFHTKERDICSQMEESMNKKIEMTGQLANSLNLGLQKIGKRDGDAKFNAEEFKSAQKYMREMNFEGAKYLKNTKLLNNFVSKFAEKLSTARKDSFIKRVWENQKTYMSDEYKEFCTHSIDYSVRIMFSGKLNTANFSFIRNAKNKVSCEYFPHTRI